MLRLDAYWLPTQELMKDERFIYSNDTGSYADYTALLSVEEFSELHEKYRPKLDSSNRLPKITAATIAIIDNVMALVDNDHDVIRVTVYEWESGFSD